MKLSTLLAAIFLLFVVSVLLSACAKPQKGVTQDGYVYDNGTLSVTFPEQYSTLRDGVNPTAYSCEVMLGEKRIVFGLCDEVSEAEKRFVEQNGLELCYGYKTSSIAPGMSGIREESIRVSGYPAFESLIGNEDDERYEITRWIHAADRNQLYMLRVITENIETIEHDFVKSFFDSVSIR
ncbi:MAG: hypothetical protein AAF456_19585 [Planctomycetota bacterium]